MRELKNALERAAAVAGSGTLQVEHLPPDFLETRPWPPGKRRAPTLKDAKDAAEKAVIERALKYTGGNRTLAAELLGIHRTGIHQKMKKYGLD